MRFINIKDEDIDLILAHLKNTNKIEMEEFKFSTQNVNLIKFAPLKSTEKPVLSEKEKAQFTLEFNI